MKKVFSTGLVMLLAITIALPARADDGSSGIFQEIYSAIATRMGGPDLLETLSVNTGETRSHAPGEESLTTGEPAVPPATPEMSPMTFPGG